MREVLATGVARDRLTYSSLRTLAALDPLVDEVLGYTRYRIEGRVDGERRTPPASSWSTAAGSGASCAAAPRTNPELRGTKHRVATERLVLVARGRSDGRTVLIVPEVKDNQTTGLTLLHVRLADDLPLPTPARRCSRATATAIAR